VTQGADEQRSTSALRLRGRQAPTRHIRGARRTDHPRRCASRMRGTSRTRYGFIAPQLRAAETAAGCIVPERGPTDARLQRGLTTAASTASSLGARRSPAARRTPRATQPARDPALTVSPIAFMPRADDLRAEEVRSLRATTRTTGTTADTPSEAEGGDRGHARETSNVLNRQLTRCGPEAAMDPRRTATRRMTRPTAYLRSHPPRARRSYLKASSCSIAEAEDRRIDMMICFMRAGSEPRIGNAGIAGC